MLRKVCEVITGMVCELLTIPNPNDVWFQPEVIGTRRDECGITIVQIHAANYRDVGLIADGISIHTHVGYEQWEVSLGDEVGHV